MSLTMLKSTTEVHLPGSTERIPVRMRTKKSSAISAYKSVESKLTRGRLAHHPSFDMLGSSLSYGDLSIQEDGGMLDKDAQPQPTIGFIKSSSSRLIKISQKRYTNNISEAQIPLANGSNGGVTCQLSHLLKCQEEDDENEFDDIIRVNNNALLPKKK